MLVCPSDWELLVLALFNAKIMQRILSALVSCVLFPTAGRQFEYSMSPLSAGLLFGFIFNVSVTSVALGDILNDKN